MSSSTSGGSIPVSTVVGVSAAVAIGITATVLYYRKNKPFSSVSGGSSNPPKLTLQKPSSSSSSSSSDSCKQTSAIHSPTPNVVTDISPRGHGTGTDNAVNSTDSSSSSSFSTTFSSSSASTVGEGKSGGGGQSSSLEDPWKITEGERGFHFTLTTVVPDMHIDQVLRLDVPRLQDFCPDNDAHEPNLREPPPTYTDMDSSIGKINRIPYVNYINESHVILGDIVRKSGQKAVSRAYVRAGPRAFNYFSVNKVRAAIVSCGGICPGMNNVIRELVLTLTNTYGVEIVYGVRNGYWGFHTIDADPVGHETKNPWVPLEEPMILTPKLVSNIHHLGGTFLGSERGGHDIDVILRFCKNRRINQLYIIGGDGTHRGAHAIATKAIELQLPLAVNAIPKTIDNDVDIIDRSFGFDTSFAEAQRAIQSAKTEAAGAPNGLGIVKVMGRYAGFIAAHATLASGDVDLCLIPEVPLALEGPASFLAHIAATIKGRGHAVVVVAEGAGEKELDAEIVSKGGHIDTDAGGNRKLPPIGPWLQNKIASYLSSIGIKPSIKFIDPSYMIRSVPANAADAVYCTLLAQNSVHGAMAGFTAASIGLVGNRLVYLPITAITANSPRRLNPRGRTVERLLQLTRQPDPYLYPEYPYIWPEIGKD